VRARDHTVSGVVVIFEVLATSQPSEPTANQWVSLLGHELRQPLTTIQMSLAVLQQLRKRAALATEGERLLGRTQQAAATMEHLVTDMLDAARIDANKFTVRKQPIDVAVLARDIADRLAPGARGASIRVEEAGPKTSTWADPERLEQVLTNLVSNAIKYGTPGVQIVVGIERRAGETEVAITNRGPGIAEDEQGRLFSRFFRARNSARIPGTGLGLFITKGIVEAHGGRISVQSAPEGPTTFRFTLPEDVSQGAG
jgi:signal transduction histidine kinase